MLTVEFKKNPQAGGLEGQVRPSPSYLLYQVFLTVISLRLLSQLGFVDLVLPVSHGAGAGGAGCDGGCLHS